MQWNDYQANEANREVAFELLFALTLPQLLIDTTYLLTHLVLSKKPELKSLIQWHEFHEMRVLGLVYICAIGLFFNIAHDAYYIFRSPGITALKIRMIIILAPFIYNSIIYRAKIQRSLNSLVILVIESLWDKDLVATAKECPINFEDISVSIGEKDSAALLGVLPSIVKKEN